MVYSRGRIGTRSLIQTAVLCALSLSIIPSTRADGSTSSSVDIDVCGISDGDKSFGIRAIDDTSCAAGGLGCYNDHCRFCKILETPQSSSFENCTTYGVEFPTMSPLVASTDDVCQVSSGDAAVGISAVTDVNCLYGGLGCFNDHCRFCKVKSTSQSEAFVDCSDYDSGSVSAADASAGVASSAASDAVDPNECTLVPAEGDVEVGISIGTDATCSAGGLGCINDVCRFCRVRTTANSVGFADCALLGTNASNAVTETPTVVDATPVVTTVTPSATTETPAVTTEVLTATTATPVSTTVAPVSTTATPANATTCTIEPSVGDAAVGVGIATDATCSAGGLGCIDNICRFCKVTTSTQSASYLDCALFNGDDSTSEVPTVTDNSDFSADADDDFSDASDATDLVADATDATTAAPASDATPVPDVITGAPVPDATTEAPAPDATTAAPAPDATTAAPAVDATPAPDATTEAPAPNASTEAPASATCAQTVSDGDAAGGLSIVTDASCSAGGMGCIDNVCRFCKVSSATVSNYVECSTITGTTTTTAASTSDAVTDAPTTKTDAPASDAVIDAPTTAPDTTTTETPSVAMDAATDIPSDATATTTATCTQTVSDGDAAGGLSIVTDTSCSAGGMGCIDDVCRFCKVSSATVSNYVECSTISGTATTMDAPVTDAPTTAPDATTTETPSVATDAATEIPSDATATTTATCTQTVSDGDAAGGLNIVTDASCSAGGMGCIDNVCRFCKVSSATVSNYVECSSITGSVMSAEAMTVDDAPLSEKSTTLTGTILNVAESNPAEIVAASAACVGVIAAAFAVAVAAKRSRARSAVPSEPTLDNEEDAERGERASPSASAAEIEPIISAEA